MRGVFLRRALLGCGVDAAKNRCPSAKSDIAQSCAAAMPQSKD